MAPNRKERKTRRASYTVLLAEVTQREVADLLLDLLRPGHYLVELQTTPPPSRVAQCEAIGVATLAAAPPGCSRLLENSPRRK